MKTTHIRNASVITSRTRKGSLVQRIVENVKGRLASKPVPTVKRDPILFSIAPFHTVPCLSNSHCAFSMKAMRFPAMMRKQGWKVVEFANEGSESIADEKVTILTMAELENMTGVKQDTAFVGDTAKIGSAHWQEFDKRLRQELGRRAQPGDFVMHHFGRSHMGLVQDFPQLRHVEPGIGYGDESFGAFRIFESWAWLNYHMGRTLELDATGKVAFNGNCPKVGRNPSDYEWVVPNSFDMSQWMPREEKGEYLLFIGRICDIKGMNVLRSIVDKTDYEIRLAGQGDITPWKHDRLKALGPVKGLERDILMGRAKAVLCPSRFLEPFCGVAVEAMLCGTPVITSNHGAFVETVEHGKTGWRCNTLGDWIEAIKRVDGLDRKYISDRARSLYNMDTAGARYSGIFRQIMDLTVQPDAPLDESGWYSKNYHLLG